MTPVNKIKDAATATFIAAIMALPLAGIKTLDGLNGLLVEWHSERIAIICALVFCGRLLVGTLDLRAHTATVANTFSTRFGSHPLARYATVSYLSYAVLAFMIIFPFTPLATRYALDVLIMVMTYIMLAWGLNITVGYAGLLDLGYAGFYAIGAYTYALLAIHGGVGFWTALPVSFLCAATAAFLLGMPVLRLRGDYFAVVTLGFGEIVRLFLVNDTALTNGPQGITNIPRPTFFGLDFARQSSEGHRAFHEVFGLDFSATQRVYFLYAIILVMALVVGMLSARLRKAPLGRAWEAFREDEIACASLGINRWQIKLMAYCLGAAVAGAAGAFFASRQGFISPESFTFTESATMLAIVILGGIGHPLGIVFAAAFIIGLPELFRDLEQYRMLAFGAGLVLIMIWRPGGMMATREPTIKLGPAVT